MQERLAHLEEAIQRLEASIARTENSLLSFVNAEETHRLNVLLEQNKKDLTASVSEWEQLGETMNQSKADSVLIQFPGSSYEITSP